MVAKIGHHSFRGARITNFFLDDGLLELVAPVVSEIEKLAPSVVGER